jgi:predicted AAA+ superfamily ATPase
LKRSGANLLAGRAYLYPLFPFVSQELKGKWNLDRAIQFGTLPKAYFRESDLDAKNFLKSYVQTYLKEEIRVEQLVRQLDPFRDFLEVAAQMSGQVINHSKIAREVGVSDKTIVSYFQILEDTHLGFILPAFHRSIRKGQAEHPKFYLFDLGVKSALQRNLDNRIAPGTASYGEAFEHIVVNEFLRMNEYSQKDYKISFFRNKEGAEIDLILSHGRKEEILIEIKSSKKIDEVEVKKLGRASHEFNAKKVYFLSADPSRQMIGKVTCLPWEIGLTEVFR